MELTVPKPIKPKIAHWRMPLLLGGGLFIVSGILNLYIGFENQRVLSILFGLTIQFSGLGEITFAFLKRKKIKGWVWFLAGGFTDFIFGIFLIYNPFITLSVLSLYAAFWLIFRSIMSIGVCSKQQLPDILPWKTLLFFVLGTMGVAFSVLINALYGGYNIKKMVAVYFIVLGGFRILLAIGLKQIHDKIQNI